MISIHYTQDNASVNEMENSITNLLRGQLQQIPSLSDITSESREGSGTITMKFEYGTSIDYAFIEVNQKVDAAMNSFPKEMDQACLEVTQEDPLGAYAVDYIKYDVKQTPSYYQVEVKLAYAVDPEELSQVISVTGSTAVEQELRALLPDQPEKVVFRISYFTQEDSAETLRQAVQEAYQAQTRPLPPLLGVEVKLYPDSGQQRVAEILLTWQAREHQTVEDFLGNLKN